MKKILAIFLSVTMVVFTFMCYGLSASAAGTTKKAVLQVEDCESRDVVDFDVKITKTPGSNPKSGIVTIKTKALKNGNTQLLLWAFAENDKRNVEIVITEPAMNLEVKKIVLKGAECVHYEETYETTASGTVAHCESISIIFSEIVNSGLSIENK